MSISARILKYSRKRQLLVPLVVLFLAACSSSSLSEEEPDASDADASFATKCTPTTQSNCACTNGTPGIQTCQANGTSYSPCVCQDADVPAEHPSCIPNAQVACGCISGALGTQVCQSDGQAYSNCVCPDGGTNVDAAAEHASCVPNAQIA